MNQKEILAQVGSLKEIFSNHKVNKAYFFGSICGDHFTNQSDVDFLISFDSNLNPIEYGDLYFSLLTTLRNFLQRDIDIVTELSLKNPYFINQLNRSKKVIYE